MINDILNVVYIAASIDKKENIRIQISEYQNGKSK